MTDYVMRVPFRADQMSPEPQWRSMCQPVGVAIVNCLWKSCAVAEGGVHPHRITLMFECESALTLTSEFVQSLAQRQMAAPTELHVLTVLCEALSGETVVTEAEALLSLMQRHTLGKCGVVHMKSEPASEGRGEKFLAKVYKATDDEDSTVQSAMVFVGFDKVPSPISDKFKVSKAMCSSNSAVVLFSLAHSWILAGRLPLTREKSNKKQKTK